MTTYNEIIESAREHPERLVLTERPSPDRAVVTMADPGKLNVLSAALTVQLKETLDELLRDLDLRTIVLTGADPGFSTGGDLRLMRRAIDDIKTPGDEEGSTMPWRFIRNEFGGVARRIAKSDKAFVAAVNGPAAGVGLAFAFACDLVIASERAVIVPAFGKLGLLPEVGTSYHLTRRLGYQRTFAFYVGGGHLDAHAARDAGLVHEVTPHDELLPTAHAWADRIAALPAHALEMTKPLLRNAADLPWEQSLTMEEFAEPNCFTTGAMSRSVDALISATASSARP
jgi:2-(1,2-epoxy-1,2-dihydrophenyl)acetyl-CoA isomerase